LARADSTAIRRDVSYLASDALEGRGTGTPGNDSAASYLARRYAALGLVPTSAGGCRLEPKSPPRCYEEAFDAQSIAAAHAGLSTALSTQNVAAVLPGTDPALRGQYVVIGAHFDHLGRSTFGALDPDAGSVVRPGADDNASGTAAVLELARLFSSHPTKRPLLFANFSGEELGLLGSQHFVDHPPVPLDSIEAMLNFDMVGRLRDGRLIVYGTGTATEWPSILDSAASASLVVKRVIDGYGPSDQSAFYARDIPVLHFFTDLHEDYHRATDVPSKINAGGEASVVDYAATVIRAIANRPARLTFVRAAPPLALRAPSGSGYGPYFGSIPDMSGSDVAGVRLTGVRAGSPADRAGVRRGDVIVEFGGVAVKDIYSYTDALRAHKSGDTVEVVVLRNGERLRFSATLESRSN